MVKNSLRPVCQLIIALGWLFSLWYAAVLFSMKMLQIDR